MIVPTGNTQLTLNNPAYIDPTAKLYGRVTIGHGASIWPYVVMRSEMYEIRIGAYTNIQDFVMIHVGGTTPTIVGENCSITHHVTLHGCEIGNNCLIGINATIMDGVKIGNNCIIGGHSLVTEGTVIPDNSVVMGTPGKVLKTRDNSEANRFNAAFYHQNALAYARGEHRVPETPEFQAGVAQDLANMSS